MKKDFITEATELIHMIGNGNYHVALTTRSALIDLFDETRNQNGQAPEFILDQHFFTDIENINVRLYFDHLDNIEHPNIKLKFFDLLKHMHYNGSTTLHNQEPNQVDKKATMESITRGAIIDWVGDIVAGRVAYKKVEIVVV